MRLSWVHIHLLFNHFPIVGAIFGFLLLVYAILKRSEELKRASYWSFVIIALITIVVFFAGTQASELVDAHKIPDASEPIVHKHRDVAEKAFIALEILGTLSLAGLLLFKGAKTTPNWFTTTFLVITIIATGLVSWTGLQGGIIRHTEVRGDLPFLMPKETESESQEHSRVEQKRYFGFRHPVSRSEKFSMT